MQAPMAWPKAATGFTVAVVAEIDGSEEWYDVK
jgi:hypothetical protein